jgi:hypothetical protein
MYEQRKDLRMPLRLEVRWNGFSGGSSAVTSDISLGGCYIESLHPVAIGDILDFDFRPATSEALRLRGQVLYSHQNIGFGVRFMDFKSRQQILEVLMPSPPASESCNLPQSTTESLAA